MYRKILVPVDLTHQEDQMKALQTAALIAKAEGAEITLLNITGFSYQTPSRSTEDYINDLVDFGHRVSHQFGIEMGTASRFSHDPAAELDNRIQDEIDAGDYDLVIMASHVPGFREYIFSSNAGYLANHAKISVFVVR